jgi:carbamoyltransferase
MINYNPNEVISIYGSHDASLTFIDKNNNIRVYEYERFVKKRYAMFSSRFDGWDLMGSNQNERIDFLTHVKNNLQNTDIKLVLFLELNYEDKNLIKSFFPNAEFMLMKHHFSHAASGYYTSNFNKSLIFSVDGGGYDFNEVYTTRAYLGNGDEIGELNCHNYDFGNPYSSIGWLISEISSEHKTRHSLTNAGKVMGLCAYGKIRNEWVKYFEKYYDDKSLESLCHSIGFTCEKDVLKGQDSFDAATTSQYVFEKKMDELILPFIEKYKTNVFLVGGCALNVLYNQKLHEYLKNINLDLYVPSNPNDCGESYGMFLTMFPNLGNQEICYSGIEILDEELYDKFLSEYPHEDLTVDRIVDYLKQGKIMGLIDGYSEVGPRALGNRSIICDPSFPNMKDILNAKVKFREWFRPFAPVCRVQDMEKYFENPKVSNYMSYAPMIKNDYIDKVKSIVHEDKTTRLQTTTNETHKLFNDILDKLDELNHIPIILNTSFNIKGLPILTRYEDSFYVLDKTELDFLIIKNKIFRKK